MSNHEHKHAESTSDNFAFVWSGGFSYLTYLKKTSTVSLSSDQLTVRSQNFVLGAFPTRPKSAQLPFSTISGVSVGPTINWFDMVFAILFAVVTIATMAFWPLLLTAFFLLRTFNTTVSITDKLGNRISIVSGSKSTANQFVDKLTQKVNQHMEMILANGTPTSEPFSSITPVRETNRKKAIFLVASAAGVALLVLTVAILSRGGSENKYVEWVKESNALPSKPYTVKEVLQNDKIFRNVEWSQVTRNGNKDDVDKFVLYESTYSDQGVSVRIRSILQVLAPGQIEPVEFSVDGEQHELPDWTLFLVEAAEKYEGKQVTTAAQKPKATLAQETLQASQQPSPTQQPSKQIDNVPVQGKAGITLVNFLIWGTSDKDKQLPLKLDGEKASIVVGSNTPNSIKLRVVVDSMQTGWDLALPTNQDSPFDDFGDLKEGFSLYLKDHDFDGNGTPEVVVAASNQLDQTFVWVFGYNFVALENGTSPLELLLNVEGQSDVILEGNKILLPFGSQGLFDEYVYNNNAFKKQ